MGSELKPCPWCGAFPSVFEHDYSEDVLHGVACSNDDCAVGPYVCDISTKDEAIAAWNTRPKQAGVTEALRLAEAALSDIGDADREPGDDLAWCERRAAKDLPAIRAALQAAIDAEGDGTRCTVDGGKCGIGGYCRECPLPDGSPPDPQEGR